MRRVLAMLAIGISLAAPMRPAWADAALEQARQNYPPLIIGANTRPADGAGPFARACPTGGVVEQKGGPAIRYLGADPANPALCRMQIGDQQVQGWYGIWLTIWPGADQASIAIGHLIRGRTGDTEAFDVRMGTGLAFHDILRNDGIEDIRLLGTVYRTVKISHYREGMDGNSYRSITTGWKDLASGMLVYISYQHIAGTPELYVPLLPTAIVPKQ